MSGQQRLQLGFDFVEIRFPLKSRTNGAMRVNEISDGQTQNSAVEFSEFLIAHGNWIVQFQPGDCLACEDSVVVHGDADDLKALWTVLTLPCHEARHLQLAWSTPGCPEVEKDHFASVSLEIQAMMIQIGADEFRCTLVGGRFLSVGEVGEDKKDGDEQTRASVNRCVQLDIPWKPNRHRDY